jgi:hypothetical protein
MGQKYFIKQKEQNGVLGIKKAAKKKSGFRFAAFIKDIC